MAACSSPSTDFCCVSLPSQRLYLGRVQEGGSSKHRDWVWGVFGYQPVTGVLPAAATSRGNAGQFACRKAVAFPCTACLLLSGFVCLPFLVQGPKKKSPLLHPQPVTSPSETRHAVGGVSVILPFPKGKMLSPVQSCCLHL